MFPVPPITLRCQVTPGPEAAGQVPPRIEAAGQVPPKPEVAGQGALLEAGTCARAGGVLGVSIRGRGYEGHCCLTASGNNRHRVKG